MLFGVFCYKELFPQYKHFQDKYVEVEAFRASYTGEEPVAFRGGIQQIVIPKEDLGPETIDRCTTCHVALKLQHFSSTKLARDINGAILYDERGLPRTEPNENYVWGRLEGAIAKLRNNKAEDGLEERLAGHLLPRGAGPADRHSGGTVNTTSMLPPTEIAL